MTEEHFPNISIVRDGVTIKLNLSVYEPRFHRAQFYLDSQVMASMQPYMPMDTGVFQQVTIAQSRALAGTGKVIAAATPYGRYLYYGKVMVDAQSGKGPRVIETSPGEYILRFRKGARLIPTGRPLTYSNPLAQPRWFEVAKAQHERSWIEGVRNILNGGG